MVGQYTESAALAAEKLFRCACLITGDAPRAERLVLDALQKASVPQPICPDAHTLEIALYKQLIKGCLCTGASDSAGPSDTALELAPLDRLERAAVVLRHFSGFDEMIAAEILNMPASFYIRLLKKSVDKLACVYNEHLAL